MQKPKKIVIITGEYPPQIGGVGDYSNNLLSSFRGIGIDASILFMPGRFEALTGSPESNVIQVKDCFVITKIFKIFREIKKTRPDIIIFQYVPYIYSKYGMPLWIIMLAAAMRISGPKVYSVLHEVSIKLIPTSIKYILVWAAQRVIAKTLIRCSDKVFVTAKKYKEILGNNDKITVLPVGSNIEDNFFEKPQKSQVKENLNLKDKFVILYFSPKPLKMGTGLLIETFLEWAGNDDKSILIIIGGKEKINSDIKKHLSNVNTDKIRILGWVNQDLAGQYFIASEVVIFFDTNSACYGGVSTKSGSVAAAFKYSAATIASSGELTDADFFVDGENIKLIRAEKNSLKEAMALLKENGHLRCKIASGGHKTFMEHQTWRIITSKILDSE